MSEQRRSARPMVMSLAVIVAHTAVLTPLGLRSVQTSVAPEPTAIDIVLEKRAPRDAPADDHTAPPCLARPGASARPPQPFEAPPPSARPGPTAETSDAASVQAATGAAIARAMRLNGDCRRIVDPAERALCQERRDIRAVNSDQTIRSIEDAVYAAEGQRALADYDRRRAPLKPNSRAVPCPNADPMGRCDFRVQTRIWSSRDGLLPDVPRRD